MKKTAWVIGAVLLIALLLGLLPLLLDVMGVAVRVFVIVPVVGTALGLFIAAIIHRYILPQSSRHRGSGTVTIYTVATCWLVVLLFSF